MDINEIEKSMAIVNRIVTTRFPADTKQMEIIGRAGRVGAEGGELFQAALAHLGLKKIKPGEEDTYAWMKGEVGDVLVALSLFCLSMGIDPFEALISKADEIIAGGEINDH